MKQGLLTFLKTKPLFVLLLPVFFVLHGYVENYSLIPAWDSFSLLLEYLIATTILLLLFFFIFRNLLKAAIYSFFLSLVFFFFGSVHDLLKQSFPNTFIVKYSVILPLLLIVSFSFFVLIRRTKKPFRLTSLYLNILFLILIVTDAVILAKENQAFIPKTFSQQFGPGFSICDTCDKPDIYFIVADEYAGDQELKEIFHFDNSKFLDSLRQLGFKVLKNTTSNYNFTPYSIASTLNMEYLTLNSTFITSNDWKFPFTEINNNILFPFFQANGYATYNYSIFTLNYEPPQVEQSFVPTKTQILHSQTLFYRLNRDLGYHLANWQIFNTVRNPYTSLQNNLKLLKLTKSLVNKKTSKPKFIYTHLLFPHYPYYFDSNEVPYPFTSLLEKEKYNKSHYNEYLQYANKKLLDLVTYIETNSPKPPIIILMSDHGFRQFPDTVDHKYHFMNLNAILLPNGDYSQFYDGMSNVNQFRILLNSRFEQDLSILKDSTIYLSEP